MADKDPLSTTQWLHRHGRRSSDLVKFWPVVVGLVLALGSYFELRFQVYQNAKDLKDIEVRYSRQWDKFNEHEHR